jgi:malate permease and related proteins
MIAELLTIIAPVFICAAVGFIWARLGVNYDTAFVTRIVMFIGMPCLVVSGLSNISIAPSVLFSVMGIALSIITAMAVLTYLLLKILGHAPSVYMPSLIFVNSGNMGIPLAFMAFGDDGLALALCYFIAQAILHVTVGIAIVNGQRGRLSARIKDLFKQPLPYAAAIGFTLILTDNSMPRWLSETVSMLGDMAIPLMLVTLGISLASLKGGAWQRSLFYSSVRLGCGFLLGLLVVTVMELEGIIRGVVLIQATMPAAVLNYLLALRYERQPSEVAGIVVTSTLLSFLTMPFLLAFAIGS